jgi:hypothetical protein
MTTGSIDKLIEFQADWYHERRADYYATLQGVLQRTPGDVGATPVDTSATLEGWTIVPGGSEIPRNTSTGNGKPIDVIHAMASSIPIDNDVDLVNGTNWAGWAMSPKSPRREIMQEAQDVTIARESAQ